MVVIRTIKEIICMIQSMLIIILIIITIKITKKIIITFNCFVLFYHILSHTNSINNLNKLCGNGSNKSIYKGKSNIWKLKSNFVSSDKVVSTSSKRLFDCVVPNGTK